MAEPFNPDSYLKQKMQTPAFNPDEYLAQKTNQPGTQERLGAALQGAGNFWTAGELPKGQALAQSLIPDPNADVNAKLKAQGIQIKEPSYNDYETALKGYEADRSRLAAQMPQEYYGGEAAAALSTAGPLVGKGIYATGKGLLSLAKNEAVRKAAEAGGFLYGAYKLGQKGEH